MCETHISHFFLSAKDMIEPNQVTYIYRQSSDPKKTKYKQKRTKNKKVIRIMQKKINIEKATQR